jgi:transcriptional regulator with XRE-family HTH domain
MPSSHRQRIRSAKEIGPLLRRVRLSSNLRQADAAALCNVSVPFLVALERGKPTARLDAVFKVCAGLGVSIELIAPLDLSDSAPRPLARGRRKSVIR